MMWLLFVNMAGMGRDDKVSYNDANTDRAEILMVFHIIHRMNAAPTTNDWPDSIPFCKSNCNAVESE